MIRGRNDKRAATESVAARLFAGTRRVALRPG